MFNNFVVKIFQAVVCIVCRMFSNVLVKMFQAVVCIVCRAVCDIFYHKIAKHLTTIFTDYLHKIVTLTRLGIGSLMMVQMDRNM